MFEDIILKSVQIRHKYGLFLCCCCCFVMTHPTKLEGHYVFALSVRPPSVRGVKKNMV